jgi:hypothetical protein
MNLRHKQNIPTNSEHTFFSSTQRIFSMRNHMSSHKTSLKNFKKSEITPNNVFDHNGIKLEIHSRRKTAKFTNM